MQPTLITLSPTLCACQMLVENDVEFLLKINRSKDELIAQKNQFVAEKDAALKDRNEALQQKVGGDADQYLIHQN